MERKRILFICKANHYRSRTAEELYKDDPRYEVRSAGIAPHSERRITQEDLQWADQVFAMGRDVVFGIENEDLYQAPLFSTWKWPQMTVLGVKDNRGFEKEALRTAILDQLRPYLGDPQ